MFIALLATPAAGQVTEPAPEMTDPVDLDLLLQLPSDLDFDVQTRGGETRGEWRRRFIGLHQALADEKQSLADARAKLSEIAQASSAWKLAPPIPGAEKAMADSPLDYQLRQEIQRHRDEIENLERKIQGLEIEANLAGVPESWRE